MLIKDAIEEYIAKTTVSKNLSKSSIANYRSAPVILHKLMHDIKPGRWDKKEYENLKCECTTRDINDDHLAKFFAYYATNGNDTVFDKMRVKVGYFFHWLIKNDLTHYRVNPIEDYRPRTKGLSADMKRDERLVLNDEQFLSLLLEIKKVHDSAYWLALIMTLTERRVSEIVTLQWYMFEEKYGILSYDNQKGRKKGRQTLNPEMMHAFITYKAIYQGWCDELGLGKIQPGWQIFPGHRVIEASQRGLKPARVIEPTHKLTSDSVRDNWFKPALKATGLYVKGQVCHITRHNMIQRVINVLRSLGYTKDEALEIAGVAAGHANTKTTEENYTTFSEKWDLHAEAMQTTEFLDDELRESLPGFENYGSLTPPPVERIERKKPQIQSQARNGLRLIMSNNAS